MATNPSPGPVAGQPSPRPSSLPQGDIARDETGSLIAAEKVNGTAVYDRRGERVGTIEDLMIDKRSGQVAYAILSFGGFLGIGEKHHPLPWSVLEYDTAQGGYVVDIDPSVLEGAPAYARAEEADWNDRAWGQRVHDYYRVRPYWDPAV
ncbi:PRC-barrel domain-containing protein [Roseomonas sp. NAR14]|uniref:PRC-barrel domain-containing protein n=1 Tax=Roseomonas acroporae TaxID=2937791 RepID=A0A9X1YEG6_9PROT|nr:PRC-barrel domain-containing protein [Roseomonas acroporae]MCK8787580.1 PRC-barrel domain-containing protein [Roseomonas acroporae]